MDVAGVREALRREPFVIRLADGRSVDMHPPAFVALFLRRIPRLAQEESTSLGSIHAQTYREEGRQGGKKPVKGTGKSVKATKKPAKKKDLLAGLRQALEARPPAELVKVILEFARDDSQVQRELEERYGVEAPPEELVAQTRAAIADATDFDEREIGQNFDYDYGAYDLVKRNFARLAQLGRLREAMELSLALMEEGSYQAEMSDESLMVHDIEECLSVVVAALRKCDLPPADVVAWCQEMLRRDRLACIYDTEIKELQQRFEKRRSKPV